MRQTTKRDILRGLIGGALGFFLIVLPILKFTEWAEREARKPEEPITVYVSEF